MHRSHKHTATTFHVLLHRTIHRTKKPSATVECQPYWITWTSLFIQWNVCALRNCHTWLLGIATAVRSAAAFLTHCEYTESKLNAFR